MKIYFNGRFLTQRITGVQRYAIEMVKAWDQICLTNGTEEKHILLIPPDTEHTLHLNTIEIKQVGHLHGHLWEQLELPFYARDGFLINLCNCAPILKKNQTVTIHDAAIFACPDGFSFLFRLWYRIMFFCLSARLPIFFTVSEFSKKELSTYLGIPLERIHVTYNGVEHIKKNISEDAFQRIGLKNNNYILAVGSVNPNKNFSLILKIAKRMPEFHFLIAGGGNSTVFQKKRMSVPDNVKFLGYVTDEELFALYAHADCFLFPSLYEGFGIPPLEAMTFGCPVIASNCASMPEIYGDAAMYCNTNSLKEWEMAIRSLLKENGVNYDLLEKNMDVTISQYSWATSVKKMLKIILSHLHA